MTMFGFPRKQVIQPRDNPTPYYFRPATYGTVSLWHRADEPAEGIVSTWNDLSGNGNHLGIVAATGSSGWHTTRDARRLRALAAPLSFLRSAAVPATGTNARTIVSVTQLLPASSLPTQQGIWCYGTNGAGQLLQLDVPNTGVYRLSITTTLSGSVAASTTLPDVVIVTYDGTTLTMYVNGASAYSGAQTLSTTSATTFTANSIITGALGARALYYELAAWNSAVDSTTATEINNLLQAQYRTGR